MLKAIKKLLIALNSNLKKSQIASGVAWGVMLGFVSGGFFWMVLFILSFFFRHHHGSKLLGCAIVKLLLPIVVFQIDNIGWQILHIESLQPFYTQLYNMPFVPFTNFNNTLVMGGLVSGVALWLPVFGLFMALIPLFRNFVSPKIRNSKLINHITKLKFLKYIKNPFKSE